MKVNIKNPKISTSFKTERVYPELEDLEVTPTIEEQNFKSSKYGFDNVTVKAIEGETLEITPTIETQEHTGIFDKVNVKGIETEELNITPSIEEQTYTGLYKDVNVSKITSDLIPNLTPENIAEGEQVLDLVGTHKGEAEVGLPIKLTNINGMVQFKLNKNNLFNKKGYFNYPANDFINKTSISGQGYLKTTANFLNWASKGQSLQLENNTDYCVSGKLISSTATGYSTIAIIIIYAYDTAWRAVGRCDLKATGEFEFSFNSGEYGDYFISLNTFGTAGQDFTALFDDIQIERGTKATEYSPYTYMTLEDNTAQTIITEDDELIISSSNSGEIIEVSEINVTPNTEEQIYDGLYNKVTVSGDTNLVPDNIKEGTSIFGVEGTMEGADEELVRSLIGVVDNSLLGANVTKLPEEITLIKERMFQKYTNLALTKLPKSLTSIERYAFQNCTNLALTKLPEDITSIGNYAFENCTNLALTELPESLISIGSSAFYNCTNLALTELPESLISIGSNAFQYCTNIALTELPESLTSIESSAFSYCYGITELTIKGNIKSIGNQAFYYCSNLSKFALPNITSVPTLSNSNVLNYTLIKNNKGYIYVPDDLVESFKTATNWSTYANQIKGISEMEAT